MRNDKDMEQIKECGWEIIKAVREGKNFEELFKKMIKKYPKNILMPALQMVEKFQIWQAKKEGIDLTKFDLHDELPDIYEPEAQFFGGSINKDKNEKKKQFGDRYGK